MLKINKQSFMVISAAVIILGMILMLTAGFGYSEASRGGTTVNIIFNYGTDISELNGKALQKELAEFGGARPAKIETAVDGLYALPQLNVIYRPSDVPDTEAMIAAFKEAHPELPVYSYMESSFGPAFTRQTLTGFFGRLFLPLVLMLVAVFVFKRTRFTGYVIIAIIHNVLLVLALEVILRLPGDTYLLAALLMAVFITVYATLREETDTSNANALIRNDYKAMVLGAAIGAIMILVSLICGAPALAAYAAALMLAMVVPFYTDAVFLRNNWTKEASV